MQSSRSRGQRGRERAHYFGLLLYLYLFANSSSNSAVVAFSGTVRSISSESRLARDTLVTRKLEDFGFCAQEIKTMINTLDSSKYFEPENLDVRLDQLRFLINNNVFTPEKVIEKLLGQPEFLRLDFEVIYEDDDYIAINKPFDVRLNAKNESDRKWSTELTVDDWLRARPPGMDAVRLCHQLDSATSGALLVARHRAAAHAATRLFKERRVAKEYAALVHGHLAPGLDGAEVAAPVRELAGHPFKMEIHESGQSAITKVHVLQRGVLINAGENTGKPATLVSLVPLTGRRHQLRLHCRHLGHPVVGDTAYAGDWRHHRLCLHARRLHLPLPGHGALWTGPPLGEGGEEEGGGGGRGGRGGEGLMLEAPHPFGGQLRVGED